MEHSENSRVKIPAIVHLTRLGYEYLSLKEYKRSSQIHGDTNIFERVFRESLSKINGRTFSEDDIARLLSELSSKLANEDLGKAFYQLLLHGINGVRLIDFEDTARNTFHVVTELPCQRGEDEFRPDVTLLINGMPLVFIEVKKPNNKEGIRAEHNRIHNRFSNKAFRRFVNITQLMIFSNNMEYDESEVVPIEGAFYASSSYDSLFFNRFREEDESIHSSIPAIDEKVADEILRDNNLVSIKGTAEYKTNIDKGTATNRILTSLLTRDRFLLLLQYGFAYVERADKNGIKTLQKHVMRYSQLFATLAIEKRLRAGVRRGIIWHTQGSGKTALAFHNVRYLRDYYQKQGKIAKFYFIVDRLDLLTQAAEEFSARGLHVEKVNSKEGFVENIQKIGAADNSGEDSITVVNIQKFSQESIAKRSDYHVDVQRVYFLDEAHRSYNPKGSFLANLMASDREAVMIALTGTPLIGEGYHSRDVFGDYIHKYYYNRSIADGYTLKLIREGIKTEYRVRLQNVLEKLEVQKGSFNKASIYSHPKYVEALVEYIVDDFQNTRVALNDNSIGAMVVCDSSDQARMVENELGNYSNFSHALILHDVDDKETRRGYQDDFKKGKIDILVVYNMLLTGFDAPRLKKQYLGRVIREHNLLQTLTRVNRPYKTLRYGYVVDFADIRKEFDKTNEAYFKELQNELGDAFESYNNIFKSSEEIEQELQAIQDKLFLYDTDNIENFSRQITALDDKKELLELRKLLKSYRELFNMIKIIGCDELARRFKLEELNHLYNEVDNRINLVNFKENFHRQEGMREYLNIAMDQIQFQFRMVSQGEMIIADQFQEALEKTRRELMDKNLDAKDPEYISLLDELKRIFSSKNIEELTADEMKVNIARLTRIRERALALNHKDRMLCAKYGDDVKYMRVHKRLRQMSRPLGNESTIHGILMNVKKEVDQMVLKNQRIMDNPVFFTREILPVVIRALDEKDVDLDDDEGMETLDSINACIAGEYFSERVWKS